MKPINILIVADALGAATSQNLMDNVYVVDTNQYIGSWQEGTDDLHTVCQNLQPLKWRVASVSPDSTVSITSFSGAMVDQKVAVPVASGTPTDPYWTATVQTPNFASYPYTVNLSIQGLSLSFSPYLKVV